MGQPMIPEPVRPILGMIARRAEIFDAALAHVGRRWGAPDVQSDTFDFDFTRYYENEMGGGLKRRFYSFPARLDPADLPEVKLWTNEIEGRVAREHGGDVPRPVNLDPGYVDASRLVLASTKDHAHRIYLAKGIYAEVTLSYHHGAWQPLPWTYPDYRTEAYRAFFQAVRARYVQERRT